MKSPCLRAEIYLDLSSKKPWIIRLVGYETPMFTHGLKLGYNFETEAEAKEFQAEVQKYLDIHIKDL